VSESCLVLDFDGTILDTEEPQFLAWAELWEEYGHDLSVAEWQVHIGKLDTGLGVRSHPHATSSDDDDVPSFRR